MNRPSYDPSILLRSYYSVILHIHITRSYYSEYTAGAGKSRFPYNPDQIGFMHGPEDENAKQNSQKILQLTFIIFLSKNMLI